MRPSSNFMSASSQQLNISRAQFKRISTATTTLVKSRAGKLLSVTINSRAIGTATIYDNIVASGTIIAIINLALADSYLSYSTKFSIGLTVVTSAAADLTVAYE